MKRPARPFAGYRDAISKLEEVEILWQVRASAHCVRLERAWVQYGYLYLQLELCAGGSLETLLDAGGGLGAPGAAALVPGLPAAVGEPVTEARIWRILADVALGLRDLHEQDILHLDIKPANIFIALLPCGGVAYKLGDFGCAAILPLPTGEEREGDRTYIAPEIISDCEYGRPADIFRWVLLLSFPAPLRAPWPGSSHTHLCKFAWKPGTASSSFAANHHSLGLVLLEMAANIILPENGTSWHKLRQGDISECFADDAPLSSALRDMIAGMLQPVPAMRPSAADVLRHPRVAAAAVAPTVP